MWYTNPAFWVAIGAVITAIGGLIKALTATKTANAAIQATKVVTPPEKTP